MTRPIALGIHLDGDGNHPAAWRFARHAPRELLSSRRIFETVGLAETAGFAFATFGGGHLPPGDAPNITARLDPLMVAAFAGPLTSRIGLVPEVDVTFVEPFHIASQFQTLDHASRGRGGWLVHATGGEQEARVFGRPAIVPGAALAREVSDVIEVNRRLWDSWEDDAVIRDTTTWRYIDRDKLHYVDFAGANFSVKGPAYVPRPPQGQLPIFGHDGDVSPGEVDVTFVASPRLADLPLLADDARARGAARVGVSLDIVLDSRGEAAGTRLARLDAHTAWRESTATRFVGAGQDLVAIITSLTEAVDVVRLQPAVIDIDLAELRFLVLPALLSTRVAAAPAAGSTLRETLGLGVAANRYTAA